MAKALYARMLSVAGALSLSFIASGCQTGAGLPLFQKKDPSERPVKSTSAGYRESGGRSGGSNY